MTDISIDIWQDDKPRQLAEVLASISQVKDMQKFLTDVMTEKEILEISARLEAARMLQSGRKYSEIVSETGLSSRTVARISEWLKNGAGGYSLTLEKLTAHHDHMSPAHAE